MTCHNSSLISHGFGRAMVLLSPLLQREIKAIPASI